MFETDPPAEGRRSAPQQVDYGYSAAISSWQGYRAALFDSAHERVAKGCVVASNAGCGYVTHDPGGVLAVDHRRRSRNRTGAVFISALHPGRSGGGSTTNNAALFDSAIERVAKGRVVASNARGGCGTRDPGAVLAVHHRRRSRNCTGAVFISALHPGRSVNRSRGGSRSRSTNNAALFDSAHQRVAKGRVVASNARGGCVARDPGAVLAVHHRRRPREGTGAVFISALHTGTRSRGRSRSRGRGWTRREYLLSGCCGIKPSSPVAGDIQQGPARLLVPIISAVPLVGSVVRANDVHGPGPAHSHILGRTRTLYPVVIDPGINSTPRVNNPSITRWIDSNTHRRPWHFFPGSSLQTKDLLPGVHAPYGTVWSRPTYPNIR